MSELFIAKEKKNHNVHISKSKETFEHITTGNILRLVNMKKYFVLEVLEKSFNLISEGNSIDDIIEDLFNKNIIDDILSKKKFEKWIEKESGYIVIEFKTMYPFASRDDLEVILHESKGSLLSRRMLLRYNKGGKEFITFTNEIKQISKKPYNIKVSDNRFILFLIDHKDKIEVSHSSNNIKDIISFINKEGNHNIKNEKELIKFINEESPYALFDNKDEKIIAVRDDITVE